MTAWTALHLAAQYGHTKVVNILLEKGASIDARDYSNQTVLHRAARYGSLEAVKMLLDRGASVDAASGHDLDGFTALHFSARAGHLEVVEMLLGKGANISQKTNSGKTALEIAHDVGIVKLLTAKGKHARFAEPYVIGSREPRAATFAGDTLT